MVHRATTANWKSPNLLFWFAYMTSILSLRTIDVNGQSDCPGAQLSTGPWTRLPGACLGNFDWRKIVFTSVSLSCWMICSMARWVCRSFYLWECFVRFFQYIRQSLWQKTMRTIYPDDMISPSHVVGWNTLVGSGITQGEISDPDEKDKSLRCWSAAAVSTLKQKLSCSHP